MPGTFHSQSLQVLSWLRAVEIWNSKPAVIRIGAGQLAEPTLGIKTCLFTLIHGGLGSKQTAEESQVTAPQE